MNELRVFENSEFGELKLRTIDGKEYFPATECARMLGYANPHKAVSDHCEHLVKCDKIAYTTNQHGKTTAQPVTINCISASDLRRLIIRSKLPAAEKFERWVFDEVLPTIRKQGAYVPDMTAIITQTIQTTIQEMSKQLLPYITQNQTEVAFRRKPAASTVSALKPKLLQEVNEMILFHEYTHDDIRNYLLRKFGINVSRTSICRHAAKLFDRLEEDDWDARAL